VHLTSPGRGKDAEALLLALDQPAATKEKILETNDSAYALAGTIDDDECREVRGRHLLHRSAGCFIGVGEDLGKPELWRRDSLA